MKLLVTTSNSILCVDLSTGAIYPLRRGEGLYYGITSNEAGIMVGARNRMVSSENLAEHERGDILCFDRNLVFSSKIQSSQFPLRDIHDISWSNNCLWITCSYENMIAIWDGSRWEKWYPVGVSDSKPFDKNHFNTIFFEDDWVWLVAHNKGASEMLKFNFESKKLESRLCLGQQAHNLWRENGHLYTCSSGEGAIVGTDGFRVETGGFPRGIAFGHGLRCVGISELAERSARDFTTARIAIFDSAWKFLSEIQLPNEGLILDIKILEELM